jgi:hypothetical protein
VSDETTSACKEGGAAMSAFLGFILAAIFQKFFETTDVIALIKGLF